jgi:ribonuclease BN (tRNA processing enzyme)
LKLAFLGTGSAFSLERHNGAVVVDGRILLDAGAPLLPQMHRLGIDPGGIETVFLSHFHGDHTLGLASFVLHRAFIDNRPLTVLGPKGVEERTEALFKLAWGDPDWAEMSGELELTYQEAEESGQVNGVRYESVALPHGKRGGTGYRLRLDGRVLAYTGDTEMGPEVSELVAGADVAIVEATQPGRPYSHMSWEDAETLSRQHPGVRFIWNHLYAGDLEQAAHDLEVIEV